jgi:hypothetical protein
MTFTPIMAYALGASAGMSAGVLFCVAIFLHVTEPLNGRDQDDCDTAHPKQ